jgi:hypothetical protein
MKHLLYQLVDCDILQNPLFLVLVAGRKTAAQSRRTKHGPHNSILWAVFDAFGLHTVVFRPSKRVWGGLDTAVWGLRFGDVLKML